MTEPCLPPEEERKHPGWHWLELDNELVVARWETWQDEAGWAFPIGMISPLKAAQLGYRYVLPLEAPRLRRPLEPISVE